MALGKYIVFEGTDGSGKTTLAEMVHAALPNPKIFTKEPGSPHIPLCVDIRKEILHSAKQKRDALTYAYLFAADTKLHMEALVIPCLKEGQWVVSDRSVMSDYAYRPRDGESIRQENFENFMKQKPIVFFIDVHDGIALQRMNNRNDANEFEKEHVVHRLAELRYNYTAYSQKKFHEWVEKFSIHEGAWYNIDNSGDINIAFMQIMGLVVGHFPELHYILKTS
jgi:dTMP kinase